METDLNLLANYYQTDKRSSEHNYTQFYEKYFEPIKHKSLTVVEIGILRHPSRPYEGASLLTWRDYFTNSNIHGIDINDHTHMQNDRIRIHIADQGNREQLNRVFDVIGDIDILIEDGSHYMHHQQISLACGFSRLKSGGIFVIEDLHTSHPQPPFPPRSFQLTPNDTLTLDMLQEYQRTGKIVSQFMTIEECDYLEKNIKSCIIEKGSMSEIAFITKK